MLGFSNVEKFTTKWEDTVMVATTLDGTQPSNSKGLGGVSFCKDQRTVLRVLGSGVVGIGQFSYPCES